MTLDQVRALPAPAGTWFNLPVREFAYGVTNAYVGTHGSIRVFGTKFQGVGFGFGRNYRLQTIMFTGTDDKSAEACKASFNQLMTELEAMGDMVEGDYEDAEG